MVSLYFIYEEDFPMKKKSKLLHVVSIIIIVFGALAVISSLFSILMRDMMDASFEMLGMTPPSTVYYVWGLVLACFELAAGIIGVVYTSKKSVFIPAVVYIAAILADLIYATVTSGFSVTYIISLVLPLLYLWGVYQSE